MAPGYGISGIGYGNDPAFLYALNSYNPNFMGMQTPQVPQVPQIQQLPQESELTSVDPAFKGSRKEDEGIGTGTALAAAGGAAALIYSAYKGKGNPIEGVKQIWNSLKSKGYKAAAENTESAAQKISNLIKEKGLKECKVKNGTDLITIKNGTVSEITTNAEQKVKNISGVTLPSGITPKSKDVTFAGIERTFAYKGKNYKVVLDKEGNVVEAFLGKKKIDAGEVEGLIDRAQTYTHEFAGKKVHIKDRSGNYRELTKNIELSVRNGELTGARYKDGSGWVEIADDVTLNKLKESFAAEIPKFGKVKKGYGLTPQECIYEYSGSNRRYLFNGNSKVTEAFDIKSTTLKTPKQVSEYLEKNSIQNIAQSGVLPEGASIANAVYRTESGNIFTIKDGKVVSVKIKEACSVGKGSKARTFGAGNTLSGNDLNAWQQALAVNNNDFNAVTSLLK